MDSRESPLRLSDSGRHPAAVAHRRDMRMEVDLRAEPVGMALGARHFRRKGVAYLRGRIAGHRSGRRGVSLFRHGVRNGMPHETVLSHTPFLPHDGDAAQDCFCAPLQPCPEKEGMAHVLHQPQGIRPDHPAQPCPAARHGVCDSTAKRRSGRLAENG